MHPEALFVQGPGPRIESSAVAISAIRRAFGDRWRRLVVTVYRFTAETEEAGTPGTPRTPGAAANPVNISSAGARNNTMNHLLVRMIDYTSRQFLMNTHSTTGDTV